MFYINCISIENIYYTSYQSHTYILSPVINITYYFIFFA